MIFSPLDTTSSLPPSPGFVKESAENPQIVSFFILSCKRENPSIFKISAHLLSQKNLFPANCREEIEYAYILSAT